MKQYEYIYVPSDTFGFEVKTPDGFDTIQEKKDVIVLSLEELRDLWNAGCSAMAEVDAHEYDEEWERKTPDFETYIRSKGIEIK